MKMLITGGAGFIGSQLAKYFSDQYEIVALDNLSYGKVRNLKDGENFFCSFVKCDVRDNNFEKYCKDVDVVIHLAGIAPLPESEIDPKNAFDNNVIGTINVLQACKKHEVPKVIFSSTSAVYENSNSFPFKEDISFEQPDLIYSQTKYTCEKLCSSYVKNYNMNITVLRFFNVYGPNQDHLRKHPPLLGYITKNILDNKDVEFYSNGQQKRDYVYIDDLCDLVEKCIKNPLSNGEIFNCCTGKTHSVKEIFEIFKQQTKSNISCLFNEPSSFWDKYPTLFNGSYALNKSRVSKEVNKYSIGTYQKANNILGWSPKVNIQNGIQKCLSKIIKEVNK